MNELGQVAAQPASGEVGQDVAWDVFLSYAPENAEWVRSFEAKLKNQGLKVFDPYSIPTEFWGQSRDEVVAAIFPSKCAIVFVVLSSAYSASEQSLQELAVIKGAAKSAARSLVLPVRLDDSPVPEAIRSFGILDATTETPTLVAEEVVAKIGDWKSGKKRTSSLSQTTDEELADRISHALERLPNPERTIITSHYFNGMTYEQMAKEMGVSNRTLQMRVHKAITKLRAMLGAEF